jgi:hypothetical protein
MMGICGMCGHHWIIDNRPCTCQKREAARAEERESRDKFAAITENLSL